MNLKYRFISMLFACLLICTTYSQIKVACVGNSITENWALDQNEKYPSILQRLLGDGYTVRNYGIGGRTMLKSGDHPYWGEDRYKEVLAWNPDIVVIKMGTNDAKLHNWIYKNQFEGDYIQFVNSLRKLAAKPRIYLCYPIPAFEGNSLNVDDRTITNEIIPIVNRVAEKTRSSVIDLHSPMAGKSDYVYDKIHPNVKGTTVMARVIAKEICPRRHFPKPAESKLDVIFIGNSITEGTYLKNPPPTVAALLLDSLGYDVVYRNCGISGYTTYDFLPGGKAFHKVIVAADSIHRSDARLVFSIKLGTNDSASHGTNGAPVSAQQFETNMQSIIDSLHYRYSSAKIILHNALWYSPNTHNSAVYLQEGLNRLQTYRPVISRLAETNQPFVEMGDRKGFDLFRKYYKIYHKPQEGKSGIFYLHPNVEGSKVLGRLWALSIDQVLQKTKH